MGGDVTEHSATFSDTEVKKKQHVDASKFNVGMSPTKDGVWPRECQSKSAQFWGGRVPI